MLFFPTPEGEQKVSVNLPGDPRTVTTWSIIPASKRIILQSGDKNTLLQDCPKIDFSISKIRRHMLGTNTPVGREMSELMKYISIAWNGDGDVMTWLSDFARSCRDIIEGKSERWSLKRVEINSEDIVLRYSDGETSGDAVLEDFMGTATFELPMAYNSNLKRKVIVSASLDDQGGRVIEIEAAILPDIWTKDSQCSKFYDYCKIVKLMLTQSPEANSVNLMRLYEFFQPHGRKVELLTDDTLRKLLDGDAMPPAPDGYRAIKL